MPNLLSGINVALRAMLAQQSVIQTIEHNVANANTPGYRRQEAMLRATIPYPPPTLYNGAIAGQLGTGVDVDYIRRFNLDFFDGRFRRESAEASRWEQQAGLLQQVEATLAETGSDGLVTKLDAFWSGWQALSDDPTNSTLRGDLRERAVGLSEAFNWRVKSLMTMRKDQDTAVIQSVDEVNDLATQVARLNVEISTVTGAGDRPNDLLDERDRILDRLAEITGATSSVQDNGEVMVSIGGHALVIGSTAFKLAATPSAAADAYGQQLVQVTWEQDGLAINLSQGEMFGTLDVRDRSIPHQLDGLNTLANELVTRVNTVHSTGYGLNGVTPPQNFFQPFTTNDYALEIRVSDEVLANLDNIAVAAGPDSPADGSLAVTISNFRTQTFMEGGTMSMNAYYTRQVGELGLELKNATAKSNDRNLVVDSLGTIRESATGVNLDEEAANLVKTQRAYQAAARLMTAVDELLDRVINGMGVVGR